uniref:Uncharacterized protein n=1 Tax=Oryza rufipogon TaxID=4529 RepID=A0A0E0RH49_ORYRU
MPKENQRISEHVPNNSTMNKEEKWLDEALDRILEKFKQMEAKRMQEEKINRIFQKLEEIEVRRSKASEEMIAAIRATTAILKVASSPTPMAPPPPAPTNCLIECPNNNITWVTMNSSHIGEVLVPTADQELGDSEDKDDTPYIITKDFSKVTHDKCSTVGFVIKCGANQADDTFQAMTGASKVVPTYAQPMDNFSSRMNDDNKLITLISTRCSVKWHGEDKNIFYQVAMPSKVGKWAMRVICMVMLGIESWQPANNMVLNSKEEMLNENASFYAKVICEKQLAKGYRRTSSTGEGANSIQDEIYPFDLVSANVLEEVVYITSGYTWPCKCLMGGMRMPRNVLNHNTWTQQLSKLLSKLDPSKPKEERTV